VSLTQPLPLLSRRVCVSISRCSAVTQQVKVESTQSVSAYMSTLYVLIFCFLLRFKIEIQMEIDIEIYQSREHPECQLIYISICISICISTYVYIYMCVNIFTCIHVYMHACMHIFTCMHAYIHTYIHTDIQTDIRCWCGLLLISPDVAASYHYLILLLVYWFTCHIRREVETLLLCAVRHQRST
jgi:hypothetical protein